MERVQAKCDIVGELIAEPGRIGGGLNLRTGRNREWRLDAFPRFHRLAGQQVRVRGYFSGNDVIDVFHIEPLAGR